MFKAFDTFKALLLLGLVQACGMPFDIKSSCDAGFYETNNGNQMHWPDGSVVDFEMHESVPAEFTDAIEAAAKTYDETFKSTRVKISTGTNPPSFTGSVSAVQEDGHNSIYWVREEDWAWAESKPHAIAITVTSFSPNRIIGSDIFYRSKAFTKPKKTESSNSSSSTESEATVEIQAQLENKLGNFLQAQSLSFAKIFKLADHNQVISASRSSWAAAYNPSSNNSNRLEHEVYMVSVHEIGHAMGRCHSDDPASIMYEYVGAGTEEIRQSPLSESDLDAFSQNYLLN